MKKFWDIYIISREREFVKMKVKICRHCKKRRAIYTKLGLCYCAACYKKIYGGYEE